MKVSESQSKALKTEISNNYFIHLKKFRSLCCIAFIQLLHWREVVGVGGEKKLPLLLTKLHIKTTHKIPCSALL